MYRFAQIGHGELKPPPGEFNLARRIDTRLVDPLAATAHRVLRRQERRREHHPRQPGLPQPGAGPDAPARERAADGGAAPLEGRAVDHADQGAAARRRGRGVLGDARRASPTPSARRSSRTPRSGSTSCVRPSSTAARLTGCRRAAGRRDLPPRDGGQHATRSCAARASGPTWARRTAASGWPTCCSSPSRARRRCSPRWATEARGCAVRGQDTQWSCPRTARVPVDGGWLPAHNSTHDEKRHRGPRPRRRTR